MADVVASRPAPAVKRRLRNYLVDRSLQLRYVIFVTVLSAVIMGTLTYLIYAQMHKATAMLAGALAADDPQSIVGDLQQNDQRLVVVMALVGLGLIVVLTVSLIVMTHKVAGPLYKIGTYLDEITEHRLPQIHAIRKGDEFHSFFNKFKNMTDALEERARRDVSVFREVLAACEKLPGSTSGELGHALAELRALKGKKEAALPGS